ncbi:Chitobiosyldiphosphodolichol beta-mannosyltransferase [Halotydeus destructor]|nr:Chitobiosyldiphosphodolichol beta-mannosyltransferase [Halotydeus destructor]
MSEERKRACVLVLGDIGRSPRMQYHAASLADAGFLVDFVGYSGSKPHEMVACNENIILHHMGDVPDFQKHLPRILCYPLKVIWQTFALLFTLFSLYRAEFILVQNPPSIPSLSVAWFVARCRRAKLVIDWHNYGFTILGLSLGDNHVLVRLCRWTEGYFGALGDAHLCVTKALKSNLKQRWNVDATVLYDRPASVFREISTEEKHHLFIKLSCEHTEFLDENRTVFTESFEGGDYKERSDRPALIISSTSWTEDEDFQLLLDALKLYDEKSTENETLPKLFCVITGKGPLKEHYRQVISAIDFKKVKIVLPWLEAEDYPKILAASDLGVCLHTSSSALDLPMKVVDMFGCCLPVCAVHYDCLDELVQNDVNGLHFKNSSQLAEQLEALLSDSNRVKLNRLRHNLRSTYSKLRWNVTWTECALPVFQQ